MISIAMKKALVIAYYFPPTGGGGVQRATKFVKYLPSFGWEPVVLTVKTPDLGVFDETLLEDIPPDVEVYRTYSFDPVNRYRVRRYGENSRFDKRNNNDSNNDSGIFGRIVSFFRSAMKYFVINIVFVPDDYVGWIPFAVARGYKIIKEERIDAIYATGKPWSSFLIAFFLSLLTGKPYILDLRDPWVLTPYGSTESTNIKHMLERFWEKICFSHAKKVISINEQITRSYVQFYPSIPADRFGCITHGFDTDDFLTLKKVKNDNFTISYVGTFYAYESPELFLQAVKILWGRIMD